LLAESIELYDEALRRCHRHRQRALRRPQRELVLPQSPQEIGLQALFEFVKEQIRSIFFGLPGQRKSLFELCDVLGYWPRALLDVSKGLLCP
jgi:hypothetical protein